MFNIDDYGQEEVKRGLELNLLGCPCCGKELNNIRLLKGGSYDLPDEEEEEYKRRGCSPVKSTVKLICSNCGYISEFDKHILMKKHEVEKNEFKNYYPSGRTDIPLDERQGKFVEEFLKCGDKYQAAQVSGYIDFNAPLRSRRVVNAIMEGRQKKLEEEKRKKFNSEL